jgi:3-methyladenine DNA glycosylase AlkD
MKSTMPFLGVSVPEARHIARTAAAGERDAGILRAAAASLWDGADHREQRYAAMQLLALRPNQGEQQTVPLIAHMVRTGRWWDYTDELAHRVADLLDAHPAATAAVVREWSRDDDFWLRRLAILAQLGRRERVDAALLAEVLGVNIDDREFFIRKAIGWALRDYARVAPDWVREYADAHDLSPLSRREALKHL